VGCITISLFRQPEKNNEYSQDSDQQEEEGAEFYRQQIWTAPELLRMKIKPDYGTPKGDVYSFAIVLQEIAYRAPPFFEEDDSWKGNFFV